MNKTQKMRLIPEEKYQALLRGKTDEKKHVGTGEVKKKKMDHGRIIPIPLLKIYHHHLLEIVLMISLQIKECLRKMY